MANITDVRLHILYYTSWYICINIDGKETFELKYVEFDKNKLFGVVTGIGNSIMAIYNDFCNKYNKAYAEYQKFDKSWDEEQNDPEYKKQKDLAWRQFKLEVLKAVHQLLLTFPSIKLQKHSLNDFKKDIESGYFEEFPEYIEVVNELVKLSE